MGLAALIGMVTPLNVLIGYDCSVHMCESQRWHRANFGIKSIADLDGPLAEEIEDSSLVLPRAIMWSVAPNAILGLLVIVTLAFTSGDVQRIMQTPTGEPFIQIFYDVTQSKAAATVMASIVVILLCSCCFSEVATSSRQLWSFARDRGFPASSWLSHVCKPMLYLQGDTSTNIHSGPSRMEHSRSCCHGLICCSLSTCLHQHRIHDRTSIHFIPRRRRYPKLLPCGHRYSDLAKTVRCATSSSQMVAGQIWTGD